MQQAQELKVQHQNAINRDNLTMPHTVVKDRSNTNDSDMALNENKPSRDWVDIAKNAYVIIALLFAIVIVGLKAVSEDVDLYVERKQKEILTFLNEESIWWIILVLAVVTALKCINLKDVFSLRTIAVAILALRITDGGEVGALMISMFIMGILSSISKLLEYRIIGKELQFIIGTPTKYIFRFLKWALVKCCRCNAQKLEWVDTKYTLEISYKSRNDAKMSIINNFQMRYGSGLDSGPKTSKWYLRQVPWWILSVLWMSTVEWVQPITELFLFAHNWRFSASNVALIIFAEFADFDKAVETWYIIQGIKVGDIIGAKIKQLGIKSYFWMAGYGLILFPTLWWAYKYHQLHIEPKKDGRIDSMDGSDTESRRKNSHK